MIVINISSFIFTWWNVFICFLFVVKQLFYKEPIFVQNKNILLYVNTSHIERFMLWKLEIKARKMLNKCRMNIFIERHIPWHLDISFLISANTVTVDTYMQKYANSTGSHNGGGMFLKKYFL